MPTLNVQFSDESKETVIAYFAGPQDPGAYDHLGEVDTSDARWAEFYDRVDGGTGYLPTPASF